MIQWTRFISFLTVIFYTSIAQAQSPIARDWTGEMKYGDVGVPFSFQLVELTEKGAWEITLINGDERIVLVTSETQDDSLVLSLRPFDAFLKFKLSPNMIAGNWEKPYRNLRVAFTAKPGNIRISTSNATLSPLGNRWAVTFKPGTSDAYPGIVLLNQRESRVTGTVMTEVGDFRYFEGVVDGDSLKISSFDGSHAFYMIGERNATGWSGEFHFDPAYSEKWTAIPDARVELRDPFDYVQINGDKLVPYYDILAAGSGRNIIDPSDYAGKVLIIQLFGTWCPNSLDETNFLLEWYPTRPAGVEVLAVTFEPNFAKEYGEKRIADYKDFLDIPYDVYFGGRMNKQQAAIAFPFMDKIEAFPTLVLIDRQGNVRYIHSYFNGPATGAYYEAFKEQFSERINGLLRE